MMADHTTCDRCIYYWLNGRGYSDYTWMETYAQCFIGQHPMLPEEEPCLKDGQKWSLLEYAKKCDKFDIAWEPNPFVITPDGHLGDGGAYDDRAAELIRAASK